MDLLYFFIFFSFSSSFIMGQSYQTHPNCVPPCSLASINNPPIKGGPPCMCRMDASPAGCQVPPCGPGDEVQIFSNFICQCTLYYKPEFCVTLRCDNGTSSYAAIYSSCPAYSVQPGSYPTPSYPSPSYPSPGYPSSSYSTSSYPASNYPATSTCSNYCVCQGEQPPDCTFGDDGPFAGDRICACNLFSWPRGCVLRQCEKDDSSFCECSPEFDGSHCYGSRCTVR